MRGHDARAARGFTLIELILVLVVLSTVLAIAVPELRGFFRSRQTSDAATALLAVTKYAHSEAVLRGQPVRLNVDSNTGAYWLTVQEAGAYVSPEGDMGGQFHMPEGATVRLNSGTGGDTPAYVQFYPSGRSDVAAIEIQGRDGEVYQVVCSSATESFRVISPLEAP